MACALTLTLELRAPWSLLPRCSKDAAAAAGGGGSAPAPAAAGQQP